MSMLTQIYEAALDDAGDDLDRIVAVHTAMAVFEPFADLIAKGGEGTDTSFFTRRAPVAQRAHFSNNRGCQ